MVSSPNLSKSRYNELIRKGSLDKRKTSYSSWKSERAKAWDQKQNFKTQQRSDSNYIKQNYADSEGYVYIENKGTKKGQQKIKAELYTGMSKDRKSQIELINKSTYETRLRNTQGKKVSIIKENGKIVNVLNREQAEHLKLNKIPISQWKDFDTKNFVKSINNYNQKVNEERIRNNFQINIDNKKIDAYNNKLTSDNFIANIEKKKNEAYNNGLNNTKFENKIISKKNENKQKVYSPYTKSSTDYAIGENLKNIEINKLLKKSQVPKFIIKQDNELNNIEEEGFLENKYNLITNKEKDESKRLKIISESLFAPTKEQLKVLRNDGTSTPEEISLFNSNQSIDLKTNIDFWKQSVSSASKLVTFGVTEGVLATGLFGKQLLNEPITAIKELINIPKQIKSAGERIIKEPFSGVSAIVTQAYLFKKISQVGSSALTSRSPTVISEGVPMRGVSIKTAGAKATPLPFPIRTTETGWKIKTPKGMKDIEIKFKNDPLEVIREKFPYKQPVIETVYKPIGKIENQFIQNKNVGTTKEILTMKTKRLPLGYDVIDLREVAKGSNPYFSTTKQRQVVFPKIVESITKGNDIIVERVSIREPNFDPIKPLEKNIKVPSMIEKGQLISNQKFAELRTQALAKSKFDTKFEPLRGLNDPLTPFEIEQIKAKGTLEQGKINKKGFQTSFEDFTFKDAIIKNEPIKLLTQKEVILKLNDLSNYERSSFFMGKKGSRPIGGLVSEFDKVYKNFGSKYEFIKGKIENIEYPKGEIFQPNKENFFSPVLEPSLKSKLSSNFEIKWGEPFTNRFNNTYKDITKIKSNIDASIKTDLQPTQRFKALTTISPLQKTTPLQKPKTIGDLETNTFIEKIQIIEPKEPKPIKPIDKIIEVPSYPKGNPFKYIKMDNKQKEDGYNVYMKEFGKTVKANIKALPKEEAKRLGMDIADNSLSASFRISKTNNKVPSATRSPMAQGMNINSNKFRQSKKNSVWWVEKRGNRLDSYGEINNIRASKLIADRKSKFSIFGKSKKTKSIFGGR